MRGGLAGYTALIIVITIQPEPLLTPQFAVERCSEIVIGIVCAIMADLLFFSAVDQTRSGSTSSWKVCWLRNIQSNATLYQAWRW
ncbi:FUSC family protein [Klebsiella pneumoniae]|nr:FUSC family protein [Klebsiella pneumoniae]